ncbi:hypothetical protein HDV04_003631 [Boothiomyces sp. JEL0838]|nr:hypothetical protein HDV04_003631 [Boothiomyces sp. JEL0838]
MIPLNFLLHKQIRSIVDLTPVTSNKSQLKPSDEELRKYQKDVATLKGIFENWTEMDLIALLEEVNGDVTLAASRISEGQAEQWKDGKKNKKEKPKKEINYRYQENNSIRGSSRGGRGGGRGGRGGRHSGRGIPHGGEKSSAEAATPAEPQDTWGMVEPEATVANTEDWSQTAVKVNEKEWNEKSQDVDVLERETEKLTITKKSITVVKAGKGSTPVKVTKTTNWASIVKGPEPVQPAPAPEPVVQVKKVVKVQKSKEVIQEPEAVAPPKEASPVQPTAPSPKAKQQPSPKPTFNDQDSEQTVAVQTQPETQLPPGLNHQRIGQRKLKQETGVVMPPSNPVLANSGVQFGSFGAKTETESKPNPKSPERAEEFTQFNGKPAQPEAVPAGFGAPGMGHFQPPFGMNGLGAMEYTPMMYDNEHRQQMGYFVPEYGNKYQDGSQASTLNQSQSPATQHSTETAQTAHTAHLPQHSYQGGYPYYPYYMHNQFQQPYQAPVYGYNAKPGYGQFSAPAAGVQPGSASPAAANAQAAKTVPSVTGGLTSGFGMMPGNAYPYGSPIYPAYEDLGGMDYKYGAQQNYQNFSGAAPTKEFKQTAPNSKTRNVRPGFDSKLQQSAANPAPQGQVPQSYYGNQPQQFGMPYMMQYQQPQQGYGNPNQRQNGYWNNGQN